jgi:serine/threonine-protein kinase
VRLQQRYVLRERVGRGGMSEVWHAHDEVLRRGVAVKALAPALAADPYLRATVRAEARAVARLNHPHITRVYDYGEATVPDGALLSYLVMELVDGQTLAARLAAGPLPWPDAARLVSQVAGALEAAHQAGLVHRDIKPANVMLTPTGAKVLDFGIAAVTGGPADAGRVGTPTYAAPERLGHALPDPASDVYALGALFYEALSGRPPVLARTWTQAAKAHRQAAPLLPPDPPGLPPAMADLCLACLNPNPRGRPTAGAVAAALARRPAAAPGRAPRPTLLERVGRAAPVTRVRSAARSAARTAARTAAGSAARAAAGSAARAAARSVPLRGLVPVGALAALAVGVLAVAMLGASLLDSRGATTDAAAAPPVASTVAASASATPGPPSALTPSTDPEASAVAPSPTPPPGAPAGTPQPASTASPPAGTEPRTVVNEFERQLTEAAAAGRVRADVAVDLRNGLADLRARIDSGIPTGLRQRAVDLRRKLGERVAERAIDAQTAAQLAIVLDPLLSA